MRKCLKDNKHLPGVPKESEITNSDFGMNVGEMQKLQMEKIEQLYLYVLELEKEIKELKQNTNHN